MKKWLPVFLIVLLLTEPVSADEMNEANEQANEQEYKDDSMKSNPTESEEVKEFNYPQQEEKKQGNYHSWGDPNYADDENAEEYPLQESTEEPVEEEVIEEPVEEPVEVHLEEETLTEELVEEPIETVFEEEPVEKPVKINMIEKGIYEISGKVRNNGEKQKNMEVILRGDEEQKVKTNEDGVYTFKKLKPGTYKIELVDENMKESVEPIKVEISNRDKINVDFNIQHAVNKTEAKETLVAVKNSEQESTESSSYLKWGITLISFLMPLIVISYFIFRKV